jgi:hypothetical protein
MVDAASRFMGGATRDSICPTVGEVGTRTHTVREGLPLSPMSPPKSAPVPPPMSESCPTRFTRSNRPVLADRRCATGLVARGVRGQCLSRSSPRSASEATSARSSPQPASPVATSSPSTSTTSSSASADALRLLEARPAGTPRAYAGRGAQFHDPGQDDLRLSPSLFGQTTRLPAGPPRRRRSPTSP